MHNNTAPKTQILTPPQFAKSCGLTIGLVYVLMRRGDVPSVQVGSRKRIDARWIERWLRTGQQQEPEAVANGASLQL